MKQNPYKQGWGRGAASKNRVAGLKSNAFTPYEASGASKISKHHAKQVANYLGTDHHEEILNPDPALILEEISQVLDQPFADSSIVPTYLLAKLIAN